MSIRLKILLVVLPILVAAILIGGASSFFSASSAVTRLATDFLGFKAYEIEKYAESQWNLLVENDAASRPEMVDAAEAAVESFASSVVRSETELVFAVDSSGTPVMRSGPLLPSEGERRALAELAETGARTFTEFTLEGVERVGAGFTFGPFGWYVVASERRDAFYSDVNAIARQSVIILAGSVVVAVLLLLLFVGYLVKPLESVVGAMKRIISSNELSGRVVVAYDDEIGHLSHTFNLMLGALDQAYGRIKRYAFEAVLAQKKETKIRNLFQLYVPKEVIDQVFANPEEALVGDDRVVSILFSDIRGFTSISEAMAPYDLVTSLNRYFEIMVDVIAARNGIVDKYIGDAIMAFWGAPVKRDDDAYQSVLAGLEMTEALDRFNELQRRDGQPEFHIGVGISYGVVTVGNIGCDKKMNYTVIGDNVNLASRLEGQTKEYRQPLLISESVQYKVKDLLPCRLLDKVAVKGKKQGVRIYTVRKELDELEQEGWKAHAEACDHYWSLRFREAAEGFREAVRLLGPEDYPSVELLRRAEAYARNPPPADWDGVEVLTHK